MTRSQLEEGVRAFYRLTRPWWAVVCLAFLLAPSGCERAPETQTAPAAKADPAGQAPTDEPAPEAPSPEAPPGQAPPVLVPEQDDVCQARCLTHVDTGSGPDDTEACVAHCRTCLPACVQRNMARAVSAEQIDEDCASECLTSFHQTP